MELKEAKYFVQQKLELKVGACLCLIRGLIFTATGVRGTTASGDDEPRSV